MNRYILLLVVLTATVFSQSECDGERYMSDIFPDIQITSNIEYGENITEDILGTEYTQTLYLDVYEPEGDNVNERPLIIFMFGGAFISNDRNPFGKTFFDLSNEALPRIHISNLTPTSHLS